jgi:hypothetical protein
MKVEIVTYIYYPNVHVISQETLVQAVSQDLNFHSSNLIINKERYL